ncbi:MAG: membrane protein insertase YidC [Aestuariivirga sp.]|uniref:membrane protein insertase YidC n=1 Tax=Aestuariivirga sp. TaxID=2650926 RepID=UPI0025B99F10|nr:membrane protein insertase YidC [Aestuariivirga sp.]MCA3562666.1 membrane protein insertase YidC [Aestuariivirga sp.]
MNFENKNFILAIVLSMLIIFGWQYFYAGPLQQKLTAQTQVAETQQAATPVSGGAVPGMTPEAIAASREEALAKSPRLAIKTDYVSGSINLKGAMIDDLHLLRYRETIDPKSPTITFFSPSGTAGALFAEQGLVAATGATAKLPDSNTLWTAPAGAVLSENNPVTITWDNGAGLKFSRKIQISDEYLFTVEQTVENGSAAAVAMIPYARIQRQDTPVVSGYWVFFEGMLGWLDGSLHEIHYKDVNGQTEPDRRETTGGWVGFTDKYWAAAAIPDQTAPVTASFIHTKLGSRDLYQTDYLAKTAMVVPPGKSASSTSRLFAGAKVVRTINAIENLHQIQGFSYIIDWGWFYFLTKPFFHLLDWIKGLVGNFGVAILIATVLVKAAVFPLANKSYASMSKMKKLQPEMERLKKEYPDDKMKQQQEMMALYKREKVSPLSGCLPVVVQIPIFFALYKVILTSIELRHAPFFGWIHDLSAPDPTSLFNLFGLIPWTPPHMLMIGVWPIIMGITMWLQMRLNPTPPDPVQASLFNWMPVMFTFMLGTFPAGLVIYWAWSNTLSILQQSFIMKRHGVDIDFFGNVKNSIPFLKKKAAS